MRQASVLCEVGVATEPFLTGLPGVVNELRHHMCLVHTEGVHKNVSF